MSSEELSLVEAFKARHSVRTFGGNTFPEEKMAIVRETVEQVNSVATPFGTETRVAVHEPGLGRMGFISHESGWLLCEIKADTPADKMRHAYIDVAYRTQLAVMKLTQHKIATVWVAGTYNKSKAEKSCPGWTVPAGIAFGEERSPHFVAKVVKWFGTGQSRKPLEELIYDVKAGKVVTEDTAGDNLEIYKCLQSGPSARNQQGWRFVVDGPDVHLFDVPDSSMSALDNGIAIANMHLLGEMKGHGALSVRSPAPQASPFGGKYICTVEFG